LAERPDRSLIVHQQQADDPLKYKDFAVMTDRWRLVRTGRWQDPRNELFDMSSDPEQRHDVVDQHPDVAERLLQDYERWWHDVSTRFDEYCEIVIGSEYESPTVLTAHSWHGEAGIFNQWHVRPGDRDNGFWAVTVEEEGIYDFELRRWPVEVDAPIRGNLPGRSGVPFVDDLLPGKPIPVTEGRIRVGEVTEVRQVGAEDRSVDFRLSLHAGPTRIQTWFTDDRGESLGAYYVYVKKSTNERTV
jgi:hypothetical protein